MNSIYDFPRKPPIPTVARRNILAPIVPEVSLLVEADTNKNPTSYNEWKTKQTTFNKENINTLLSDNSLLKKQVRFDKNFVVQEQTMNDKSQNDNANIQSSPLLGARFGHKKFPNLKGKTFNEIYMANIPNRHLDLSIIEPNNKPLDNKEVNIPSINLIEETSKHSKKSPTTYKEFKSQTNFHDHHYEDCITDILNYKSPIKSGINKICPIINSPVKKCDESTQTSPNEEDHTTIKELLKIIQQQNEQILLLQRKVLNLGNETNKTNVNNNCHDNNNNNNNTKTTSSPSKGPTFSIDLRRTSFEVSFRQSQPIYHRTNKKDFIIHEPKIKEINEVDDGATDKNLSLRLQDSLNVRENCPSPEPSIKIDMDKYHSSEEESEDENNSKNNFNNTENVFVNNVMGQVSNILQTNQFHSNNNFKKSKKSKEGQDSTMKKVKEATLKHLKSIGINLPQIIEDSAEYEENNIEKDNNNRDNVSIAVKQLLMKYLPDEYSKKLIQRKNQNNNGNNHLIPTRPEFSFASIQYLKKYNLLPSDKQNDHFNQFIQSNSNNSQNVIDITAFKMQPKLL